MTSQEKDGKNPPSPEKPLQQYGGQVTFGKEETYRNIFARPQGSQMPQPLIQKIEQKDGAKNQLENIPLDESSFEDNDFENSA